MERSTGSQKDMWENLKKREFEMIKQFEHAFGEWKKMLLGTVDFKKTYTNPQAFNFWGSVRKMAGEHDQMMKEVGMDPLPFNSNQDEKARSVSAGGRDERETVEENDPAKKTKTEGQRVIKKENVTSAERLKKENERLQGLHKSSIAVKHPLSVAPDSPQPTTDVNEGSVNQQEGGASQKKHDKDIEKLEKEIKELEGLNARMSEDTFEFKKKLEREEITNRKLDQDIKSFQEDVSKFEKRCNELEKQLEEKEKVIEEKNKLLEDLLETRNKHLQHISILDNAVKKSQQDIEDRDRTIMSLGNDLSGLSKEHNDLKSRFSKLAGHKLTDQNPDIADLSDPNRAMKLSEKFGALYDDAWTDAFEHLTGKQKQNPRDAIQFLLERLKDCRDMCKKVADTWMDSLQNVFLHPVQDTEAMSKIQGGKVQLRLGSKEQRLIRDVCRKVAPTVGVLVKQYFITQMKTHKLPDGCLTYLEGCVDVCWLMVLAEPPLHIDFNIKPGAKFDPNRHAAYSSSGETVEFLVWPPLYNAEEGGGMLSKGTVSTENKIVKKKK